MLIGFVGLGLLTNTSEVNTLQPGVYYKNTHVGRVEGIRIAVGVRYPIAGVAKRRQVCIGIAAGDRRRIDHGGHRLRGTRGDCRHRALDHVSLAVAGDGEDVADQQVAGGARRLDVDGRGTGGGGRADDAGEQGAGGMAADVLAHEPVHAELAPQLAFDLDRAVARFLDIVEDDVLKRLLFLNNSHEIQATISADTLEALTNEIPA